MPATDALLWLHGTPATPSNVFTSTSSNYSDNEIDFGAVVAGTSYPYIPQFPSATEKGYTFPPEQPGNAGVEQGVHVIIAVAIVAGSMTAATINVVSDATSSATDVIASRTFTLAQVETAGIHLYIPVTGPAVLRYLRANFLGVTAACSSGTAWAWYGPKTGGEQ